MSARDSAPVGEANNALSPRDERAVTDNGWQPIETAPRDRRILAYNVVMGVYATRFLDGEWPCARMYADAAEIEASPSQWDRDDPDHERRSGVWYPRPTHWQPLPEAPSKDRGEAPNTGLAGKP